VFYIAIMDAVELTRIASYDMRRMVIEQDKRRAVERYLGIQRPLRDDRVREIKQYVQGADAAFPSSVVLSVSANCATWDEDRGVLTLMPHVGDPNVPDDPTIPFDKIAQIIDGQHRVKGLEDWTLEDGEFQLPVSIFVGSDISTDATLFATVNLTQTKVNRSLGFDLFELAKSRSPQKTAHDVAVVLDSTESSPLYKRIKRLGVATKGRLMNETLTQATIVDMLLPYLSSEPMVDRQYLLEGKTLSWPTPREAMKQIFRIPFIQEQDEKIVNSVWNYLDAVKSKWPEAWKEPSREGAVLCKTNGFRALIRLMRPIFYALNKKPGEGLKVDEVSKLLALSTLKDSEITTENFPPGTSGEAALYNRLLEELKLSIKPPDV
jgi:DGQHR domain-containing protein